MGRKCGPGHHHHSIGNMGVNRAQEGGCTYCAGG
jgi:hypothetical protein